MPLFKRPDGHLATDVAPFRRMMPFLMPTRSESVVFFEQDLDLTKTLPFLERYNAEKGTKVTVFHLFTWAIARVLHERPRMNRFVMGHRIYQRDGAWLSFSAKKSMADGAPIVVLKRRFEPNLTFDEAVARIQGDVKEGRGDKPTTMDKDLAFFLRLPNFMLALGVKLFRFLDSVNLLPASVIRGDPLYTSFFIANLGSVKLESAFHHLYEWGNCPLFAAIGRTKKIAAPNDDGTISARSICTVKYAFDERIEDGLYCAQTLELLRKMVEDPEAATGAAQPTAQAA